MFKAFLTDAQLFRTRQKQENLDSRQASVEGASSIAFVTLAENGSIDEVTAAEHTELFSLWGSGIAYSVGALRQHDNILYKCVQAHTSQDDWTPDISPSLWVKASDPAEEYPDWSQPIGSHDAYNTGDKVTFDSKHWISTCDANIWQPGVYGWEEVTE